MHNSTIYKEFPFRSVLNLRLLIEYWERAIDQGEVPAFAKELLEKIQGAPELRSPIEDFSILDKHRTLINFLMSAVVPPAGQDTDRAAAILPFQFKSLYSTRAFEKTLDFSKLGEQVVTGPLAAVLIAGSGFNRDVDVAERLVHRERRPRPGIA